LRREADAETRLNCCASIPVTSSTLRSPSTSELLQPDRRCSFHWQRNV